jgi:hypothetical protein
VRALIHAAGVAFATLAGCHDDKPSTPPAARSATIASREAVALADLLPDAPAPFAASALVRGDGWLRRSYTKGEARIDVTVAARAMAPDAYEEWVRQSRDYPAAALEVAPDAGSGFYSCGEANRREACDLHIQLRSGLHVEVMGNGASRADLDELLGRIPLGRFAASARAAR